MEWISCNDKLPEFDEYVFVMRIWEIDKKGGKKGEKEIVKHAHVGYLIDKITNRSGVTTEWKAGDEYGVTDVQYWMPIPPLNP